MKQRIFFTFLLFLLTAESAVLLFWACHDTDFPQDTVAVNEVFHSVQRDWGAMEDHVNPSPLDYVILDGEGQVLFRTREGLSETLNQAVRHRDTILYLPVNPPGRLIIYNDSAQRLQDTRRRTLLLLTAGLLLQWGLCGAYLFYLHRTLVRPFHQLKGFAERIAGGNLDIPLEMDRQNLFGAFTESFDLMRTELKRARAAEAQAAKDKKELVANLSHDIKTPVASIKAAAEVGAALAGDDKNRTTYTQIIQKADQINTLVTNLFTAALEELTRLSVSPTDMTGRELAVLLENADYLHRAVLPPVPDCLLYADRLRLQQVLDNLFANSYKYADTPVTVTIRRGRTHLYIAIEDQGGGVAPEELPFLKEKFRRGSNVRHIEGAGLGLYLSDYFLNKMQGELLLENGPRGLRATVAVALCGAENEDIRLL